jgi:hypothetical protein
MSFNGFGAFTESPVFENIIKKEALSLNIAFACFYGSRNYNLETDKSDYDFFIVYYPVFENFFTHRFPRSSVIEKDYDYFITPFHEYFRHAMNGNIKFIEPLICNTVFGIERSLRRPDFRLIEKVKNFIVVNFEKNFGAMAGIIKNKKLNVEKGLYTSNTLKYKESHGYDIKEAINSLRIAFLLEHYINTGEFSFEVKQNPVYKEFEIYLSGINDKKISKNYYLEIINKKMDDIAGRYEKLGAKEKPEGTLRVEIKRKIEQDIVEICRDKACFAKNN